MTAFSMSPAPPTLLVFGIDHTDASHHRGNTTQPMKNIHACTGDALPGSPASPRRSAHPVGCTRLGLRGSRMWNAPGTLSDGACGEISALIGIETCERLGRGWMPWPWPCLW